MSKTRVYELAKELGIENKDLITRLERLGIAVKSHSSSLEEQDIERVKKEFTLGERSTVIEKRVKSGVIRRRAIRRPDEPAEVSETGEALPPEEAGAPEAAAEETTIEQVKPEEVAPVKAEAPPAPAAPEEAQPVKVEPVKEPEPGPAPKAVPPSEEVAAPTKAEEIRAEEEKVEAAGKPAAVSREAERPREAPARGVAPADQRTEKRVRPVTAEAPKDKALAGGAKTEEKPVEKPEEAYDAKKKKRPVEVVVEEFPVRKKAFLKQRVDKKERRVKKSREAEGLRSWKDEKKEAVIPMKETMITTPKAIKRRIKVQDAIRVGDLAKKMGVKASEIIGKLMGQGMMVTINQSIDVDTATLVASEFDYQVESSGFEYEEFIQKQVASPEKLKPRPPVVTIMGHVDHGKTSLLDAIRETNVIDGESGGITQAIGAYHVTLNDRDIAFVDTPGHEAFTAMRARGAQVTDIVVLVVAADDGVMDQTVEAINHSKAAGVPIIVAINKIDKSGADPERIKQQLSERGLVPEAWGGDTIYAEVSAKQKVGIEELLELILLQADVLELKADPDRPARGVIIESELDKGRGPVATVIVQEGTLREGDALVSKTKYCKVRAMLDDKGRRVKAAGPSMPVEVIGFSDVPQAGMDFVCVEDDKKARNIADYWARKERERELSQSTKITLEQLYERIKEGTKEFNVIIKADVQGSVEALTDALLKLSTDDVKLKIIHGSAGTVTETDVMLASASDAIIIGFKVRPDFRVSDLAEREGVDIKLYDIIYDVIADVRAAMEGLLEPIFQEVVQGRAEVRQIFRVPKLGVVAGSFVTDGKISRNSSLRLLRDGVVIYEGKIISLKRFKDDSREVTAGYECGIGIENFNDIRENDVIEAYIKEEVKRKLE